MLAPFLETSGAPLAGFCSSEPGGSANAAAPPPGEGVRTGAVRRDGTWVINGRKKWVSSATGWNRDGADLLCVVCRTDPDAAPDKGISILAVEKPYEGVVFERAITSPGYRAHLLPEFSFRDVTVPARNVLGAAALVGILGVALMRAAFEHSLHFARTQRRGGIVPIIEHQAVGYALVDAKIAIEATRSLAWRASAAIDARHPAAAELANHSKIFGSETAVRVITDLMRVVGIDSYDNENDPLNGLLQDALALPIFAGGNMGVRRRGLHAMLTNPGYDPLAALDRS
jgi:butyryl-CoA dehydrogenase